MTSENDQELQKILQRIDKRLASEGVPDSDQNLLAALKANPDFLSLLIKHYHDQKSGQDKRWYQSNQLWSSLDKEVQVQKLSEKGHELKIDPKQLTTALNYDLLSISQQSEDIDPVCLVTLRRLLARQALHLRPSLGFKDELLIKKLKENPQAAELVLLTEKKFLISLFQQQAQLLKSKLNRQDELDSVDLNFNTLSFTADHFLQQTLHEQAPNLYQASSEELIKLLLTTELELWARLSQEHGESFYHRWQTDKDKEPEPIFGLPDLGLTMFTTELSDNLGIQATVQLPNSPLILPLTIDGQASPDAIRGEVGIYFGQMGKLGSFASAAKDR